MDTRVLFFAATIGLLVPPGVWAEEDIAVAVMEFASKGGIEADKMDALSDMLANEIRRQGNFRVVGKSDIRAALQLEEQKQLLGCSDDSCIAEIGGALGVRWVVVGNISKFGKTYLLNLKLMDVVEIKVLSGISKKVTGGEDMLIDALSAASSEMIAEARGKMLAEIGGESPDPPAGPETSEAAPVDAAASGDEPPGSEKTGESAVTEYPPPGQSEMTVEEQAETPSDPYKTWGHVTFWSGAGLLTLGVICAFPAKGAADDYYNESKSLDERVAGLDNSRLWTGAMWAGLGTGLALMTTGVVLWLLKSPKAEDADTTAAVGPTPDGAGLVLTFGGRW